FTLLGGVASFLLNEKVYTSSASLIVGEEKEKETGEYNEISGEPIHEIVIQYGNATISKQLNKFYNDTIKSRDLLEEVIQSLNLDISVENLRESITIEVPEDSGSIIIKVSGPHLNNADEIVDKVASVFMDKALEITEIDRLKLMNSGSDPQVTNTVNVTRNILISIIAGFLLGAVLVIITEYLDDSIQSIKEIEEKFGIPVIGTIKTEETREEDLKNIRTKIEFSPRFKDKKTVVVTAPTKISENISVDLTNVLAETDNRVILIDADLRQPFIQKRLNLSDEEGLSEYLEGKTDLVNIRNNYNQNKKYQVITAGNSLNQPSEKLSNDILKQLLAEEYKNYDYIILNGHPVDEVTDTVVLSTLTDGVILLVKANKTKVTEIRETKKKFEDVGVNILGVVFSEI